ncbi:hypothetical protein [Sphingomonas sp. IW22]|uniref:hypothetical protein n=1 Tax=Sphingomonas sp. IW22 TaxID=3242489 RepID=UPI003520D0E7
MSSHDRIYRPVGARLPRTAVLAGVAVGFAIPVGAQTMTRLDGHARVIASDNPFLLDGGDTHAVAMEVAARPDLRWQPGPSTFAQLRGEVAYRRYLRRYGDFLTGDAEASLRHRASDFISADASLTYARELPIDGLTESSDFAVDPTTVRQRISGRGAVTWTPNSRDRLVGAVGFERLRYSRAGPLAGTNARNLDVEATRRITERTRIGVSVMAARTRIAGTGNLAADGIRAVIEHQFSPHLNARGRLGFEWTRYDIGSSSARGRLSGNANICYRPERVEGCFTASVQNEVSGIGGLQRERFVGATFRYRLDEWSSLTALADRRSSDLAAPLVPIRTRAERVGIGYERRVGPRLMLTGNADYQRRQFAMGGTNGAFVILLGISLARGD